MGDRRNRGHFPAAYAANGILDVSVKCRDKGDETQQQFPCDRRWAALLPVPVNTDLLPPQAPALAVDAAPRPSTCAPCKPS